MIDLTLEQIKLHLRVDHDAEDAIIEHYRDAAIEHAEQYLNARLIARGQTPAADGGEVVANAAIEAALLLTIGDLYAVRENTADNHRRELPNAAQRLLLPYRQCMGV